MRQLLLLTEGAQRDRWRHTSAVLAMMANVNRDPKKTKAYKPADFDPFEAPRDVRNVVDLSTPEGRDLFARMKRGDA